MAMIVMFLVPKIRFASISAETATIMVAMFFFYLFGLHLVLLISMTDFSHTPYFRWFPYEGPYMDLTEDWYLLMGPLIVGTMISNIF